MSTQRGGAGGAATQKVAAGSEPLTRLRRGEISLDAYLDFRADEAVRELGRALPPARVAIIRAAIREQLASDPVLLALVDHVRTVGREGETS